MNAPPPSIMEQHDPNDDPFAALSQETDETAPKLLSPMDFGMGLKYVKVAGPVDPTAMDGHDPTEATHDETEHDATLECHENVDGKEEKSEEKA